MEIIDFGPATDELTRIVRGVRDDQLGDPTPCRAYTVADLLDHVAGLALAFRAAAAKEPIPGDGAADVDGSRLDEQWCETTATRLGELAAAWRVPQAYDGLTMAGPVEMPAGAAALVALDEVVVHGWDLARATGQAYAPDEAAVLACLAFVEAFEVPEEAPAGGPFGPPVHVPGDAPVLDRLVGATGRNPSWRP